MLTLWLVRHFDPQWKLAHLMWSMRIAAFQAVIMGAWMGWPAFEYLVPPLPFMGVCIFLSLAAMVAKTIRQKNVPSVDDIDA